MCYAFLEACQHLLDPRIHSMRFQMWTWYGAFSHLLPLSCAESSEFASSAILLLRMRWAHDHGAVVKTACHLPYDPPPIPRTRESFGAPRLLEWYSVGGLEMGFTAHAQERCKRGRKPSTPKLRQESLLRKSLGPLVRCCSEIGLERPGRRLVSPVSAPLYTYYKQMYASISRSRLMCLIPGHV